MTRMSRGSIGWSIGWQARRTSRPTSRKKPSFGQYRGESSLATWLHTIAVSVALNGKRKVKRIHGRMENVDESPRLAVEPHGLAPDLKTRLHSAIDALSEKLQPVFAMDDVEGYTHDEMDERLIEGARDYNEPGPDPAQGDVGADRAST